MATTTHWLPNLSAASLIRLGFIIADELIEIFSKIKNKKSKLYIIGDGEEKEKLKGLAKQLNLENRVVFLGYLSKEEQIKYYKDSCIFAMTSISEGLPMVLLESMSYGIPCIAYQTECGVSDIIDNNINGIIIQNRDDEQYINMLNKVLSDKTLNIKLSNNSVIKADMFSKENIIKLWHKVLNERR